MVCMWYGVVVIDWFVSDVMVCCVIGVLKVVLNVVVEWEWLVCVLVMKCVKVVLKCICWLMLVEVEWLFVELFVYFVDMVCFSFEIGLWCVNVIGLQWLQVDFVWCVVWIYFDQVKVRKVIMVLLLDIVIVVLQCQCVNLWVLVCVDSVFVYCGKLVYQMIMVVWVKVLWCVGLYDFCWYDLCYIWVSWYV